MSSMKPIFVIFAGCLMLGITTNLRAAVLDTPFTDLEAHYHVFRGSLKTGDRRVVLEKTRNNHYRVHAKETPNQMLRLLDNGAITESSIFFIIRDILSSKRYSYFNSYEKPKQHISLVWDWEAFILWGEQGDKFTSSDLDGYADRNLVDPLTFQFLIMHDIKSNRLAKGYRTTNGHEIVLQVIKDHGKDKQKFGRRSLTTKKIEFRPEVGGQSTTIWFARELKYFPIRIEYHYENKQDIVLVLNEYKDLSAEEEREAED
ncbi:MAG: DUF3108 domain-containing protein [Gammaproteobacteria bacterium]|nr:DUF3108 domain-containing protein [Gammaproteobacteria bacterium]